MSKKLAIIAASLLAATPALAPAWAQNATCIEPAPPKIASGSTAAQADVAASITQVRAFIAQSDVYQTCIAADLEAKKQAATPAVPFDSQLQQVALAKVAANQAAKDQAAKDMNTQIAAFKQRQAR